MTYATTKAAHRAWLKANGFSEKPRKKPQSKFETARFVAVDGEGFSEGPEIRVTMGNPPHEYVARDHHYALLTDSDGEEIYVPRGRLSAKRCLDFLLSIGLRDKHAVPVIFGGTYDICHMLAFSLSEAECAELLAGDGDARRHYLDATLEGEDYRLDYRPRKHLTIRRWPGGADKYERHTKRDGTSVWRLTPHDKVTLWDVWGYFQSSFVTAMEQWLPDDPDWQFIRREKGNRSVFDRAEIDTIRRYNAAEVRCLAAIMERVRDSIRALGLTVTRWDGAGAIAGAMFKFHTVKDHMAWSPDDVFTAARVAYSGGHIEACKVGFHDGPVYHYDINSAYPHQFRSLPSLATGRWIGGTDLPPRGFTLVQIAYRFVPGLPFYPLFYRNENGTIIYGERGRGWYWFPEYEAGRAFAEKFGAFEFRVMSWWHFETRSNDRPFRWIEDYYARRQHLVAETKRSGVPNGEEKTIKLGLNSCYGKTAQQVGARVEAGEIVPPAYFQLEWSGYVTAGCRAQLMLAATEAPETIISFATDALFSTAPLSVPCPPVKELGAWESLVHTGMTIVMPGVYWLHDDAKTKHYSRGYDKSQMEDYAIVHEAWRAGKTTLAFDHTRMVTLGNACMSEGFWKLRGLFTASSRVLQLDGSNSKRWGVAMSSARPHKELCVTRPRDIEADYHLSLDSLCSAPYPIGFLDADSSEAVSADEAAADFFVTDPGGDGAFFLS